jgi:hypothetical protein
MTRHPDHNSVSEYRGGSGVYRGRRAVQPREIEADAGLIAIA